MSETKTVSIKEQNKSASSSLLKKNIRKFLRNKLAVFGLVVVILMTIACVGAMLAGIDFSTPNPPIMKKPPSAEHLFGTDTIGRDLLARVLYGGCYSIFIGVFCAVLSSVVGAILGTRGLGNMLFIFVFTGWMTTFRMVRNEFMSLKNETYVKVSEAFGMSKSNVMFKQILPNVLTPIIVSTTTNVAYFILQEASLSFIGLGVADSTPTWGNILNAAKSIEVIANYWWLWAIPGAVITIFVLAVNFFGDGLRDVLDPKQQ